MLDKIAHLIAKGSGSPGNLMKELQQVVDYMDKMGYAHADIKFMPGYDILRILAIGECKNKKKCD